MMVDSGVGIMLDIKLELENYQPIQLEAVEESPVSS